MAVIEHFPLMVPGVSPASQRAEVCSPFDGSRLATVEQVEASGVECALATADRLFNDRDGWLPPAQRMVILRQAAVLMQGRREELAREAAREGGKPLKDSLVEVDRAIDGVALCATELQIQAGREIPMNRNAASAGRLALTQYEPIGPVLAFSAFNHPLNMIVHQVGPAVAAGCPVIVKPAAAAPLSGFRFVQILRQAGLPEPWCQPLLLTDHSLAERMVADPRIGYFSFVGSGRVGWALRSRLAPGTRCGLEHGGVAPVVVAPDADLDDALPLVAKGGFYHAGQVCVSVQRVFAHRQIARSLAERLAELARGLQVGDPTLPETDVGPLIRRREVERVDRWVQEAVGQGASLLSGGKPLSATCYDPTVLLDPPEDARVMTEEVFGPVVCVAACDDLDEAIARSNRLRFAFQAAVFTRDLDTALRCCRRLSASTVMVNDHTAFRVDWMPFAGLKESGLGVGGIPYTMEEMQIKKLIVIRSKELR
jgi:acyl-CoA reductase-like NAD-dependent aldehyde dehydrogenase